MEGTLTDETAREAKTFAFKAPSEYASILSGSSIEAANLANNHSHDYGEKSYTDTISALEDAGIASFGYNRIKILKIKGIKVGVTGIYELADHQKRASQVKQNIKALKKAGAQVIIVISTGELKSSIHRMKTRRLSHILLSMKVRIL